MRAGEHDDQRRPPSWSAFRYIDDADLAALPPITACYQALRQAGQVIAEMNECREMTIIAYADEVAFLRPPARYGEPRRMLMITPICAVRGRVRALASDEYFNRRRLTRFQHFGRLPKSGMLAIGFRIDADIGVLPPHRL